MKISDSRIHFFRYQHFSEENCRSNLIANIILFSLKLFIIDYFDHPIMQKVLGVFTLGTVFCFSELNIYRFNANTPQNELYFGIGEKSEFGMEVSCKVASYEQV